MSAHANEQLYSQATRINPHVVPIEQVKPGQTFMRLDYQGEVLAPLSYANQEAHDTELRWAVVVAVNHDSAGFVPGQLISIRRGTHVRLVHSVRHAIYALEL